MATEITLAKCQDGSLRPVTQTDQDLVKSWKLGQGVRVKAVMLKPRSIQHHRMFFGGLLGLTMEYWEPSGGLITPAERKTLSGFASWLDKQGGNTGAVRRAQDEYLRQLNERRSEQIQAPEKSLDALLEWLKLEVGHYDMVETPVGIMKRTKSINFNSMDQDQFRDFYKRCFSVVWRFVLSKTFSTEQEAQAAVDQLLQFG